MAHYLGIDPAPVRIIWVIVALGGAGVPAYLIAWVLMPGADGTHGIEAVKQWLEERSGRWSPWLLAVAVGIGLLWLNDTFNTSSALFPAALIGGGLYLLLHDRDAAEVATGPAASETTDETARDPLLVEAEGLWDPPVPPPPPPQRSLPRPPRSRLGRWATGLLVLGLGTVGVIVALTSFDPLPSTVMAVALLWCGAVLIASAWHGRARGLLPVGAVLVLAMAATSAFDVPLRGGFGERQVEVPSVSDIDPGGHRLTAGSLELDLRGLTPREVGSTRVEASVAFGELILILSSDQAIHLRAHVDVGQIVEQTEGGSRVTAEEGVDIEIARNSGSPEARQIDVDAEVGFGEITVRTINQETP